MGASSANSRARAPPPRPSWPWLPEADMSTGTLAQPKPNAAFLKYFLDKFLALGGLLILCTLLTIRTPNFLPVANLFNVARQISINGVVAVGMTIVIVPSGIDLSVGSVLALAACVMGL